MTRDEFEAAIWVMLGVHKRGNLSEPGLVEAISLLAVEFAADDGPEVTAARRDVLQQADGGQ